MAATTRTIPVHALADKRIHLAPAYLGRLRQGRLKTLCGLVAVTALSPFAMAEPEKNRCKACFGAGEIGASKPTAKPAKQAGTAAKAAGGKATGSKGTAGPERPSKPHSGRKTPQREAPNSSRKKLPGARRRS